MAEGRLPAVAGVLSSLSQALDMTEGHPRGHAVRTAMIGLRLGEIVSAPESEGPTLLHALLLKDAGCSANASRVYELFGGGDHEVKRAVWERDWRKTAQRILYAVGWAGRGTGWTMRLKKLVRLGRLGSEASRELFQLRCDRGAEIARLMKLGEPVASAIHAMDEHWDGGGYPNGLLGDAIPLAAQIIAIAQVMEIFWGLGGPPAALKVVSERSGTWFDPQLARAVESLGRDSAFWEKLKASGTGGTSPLLGEIDRTRSGLATDDDLDRIAEAFALIIDGKSPYTADHSRRMAGYATAIADRLGLGPDEIRATRRAALVHDLGKLAVPNAVLEKPGQLDEVEWEVIRRHPALTLDVLRTTPGFAAYAVEAAAHHERLDGSGYHLGLDGSRLSTMARVLAVADTIDAMAAPRPYRGPLSPDMVLYVLRRDAGTKYCTDCVDVCSSDLIGGTPDERVEERRRADLVGATA